MKNIFTLFLVLISISTFSQNVLIEDSIPANKYPNSRYRNDVHIDGLNNYWIAFDRIGLGKFDGANWTFYDSLSGALPVNKVNYVTSDSLNNIYLGTSAGFSIYNGTAWQHYDHGNSLLPASGVNTVEVIGTNAWIGTNNGLYFYNGLVWNSYTKSNSGIIDDTVTCITFGKNGEVWAGTRNGISKFYQNTWTNYGSTFQLPNLYIRDLAVNGNNELWEMDNSHNITFLNQGSNGFISINTLFPSTEQGCHVLFINGLTYSIESNDTDIFFTTYNILNYDPNHPNYKKLFRITPQHVIKYLLYELPPNNLATAYFAFNNYYFALMRIVSSNLVNNSEFFTINLNGIPFQNFPTIIRDSVDLNINEVRSRINNDGEMHWDPNNNSSGIYEVPACSGKNTLFASALWLGGYDQINQLHVAAMTYSQNNSHDFWPGPLDTITATTDSTTIAKYNRTWKVNRVDIDSFIVNYQANNLFPVGTYYVPEAILNWPAHGTGNNTRALAPFFDNNSNGLYNPYDGDYPQIDGDQEIWWVFNDSFAGHTETGGSAFGFEIQAKAYAYKCNAPTIDNVVINYTQFYQYKIINRSSNTYHNIYIGLWCDIELGDAGDDYVGCDIGIHNGFGYNGDSIDGGAGGYGLNPPYQNVTVLKGPLANTADGIDNNFNGITDEPGETTSMNHFNYHLGVNASPIGFPSLSDDYYQYLNAQWLDGTPITYGGDGRGSGIGSTNNPCNFMFPGNSDPTFITPWTMPGAGIQPTDMRMLLSSGKFSIAPGETRTIDFAYITTRDTVTFPNFTYNHNEVAKVLYWFNNNLLSSCPPPVPVGVLENDNLTEKLIVRPNPARDVITIENVKIENDYIYTLSDITGKIYIRSSLLKKEIDISKLSPGLYFIRIENKKETRLAKFIKLK